MKKIIAFVVVVVILVVSYAGLMNIVNKLDQIGSGVAESTASATVTEPTVTTENSSLVKYNCGICSSVLPTDLYCDSCGQQWYSCTVCLNYRVYTAGDGGCVICGDSTNLK